MPVGSWDTTVITKNERNGPTDANAIAQPNPLVPRSIDSKPLPALPLLRRHNPLQRDKVQTDLLRTDGPALAHICAAAEALRICLRAAIEATVLC